MGPDPHSRTPEHEGRRVAKVEGGWLILNHKKYRDMMSLEHRREYKRLKSAEYRKSVRDMDMGRTMRQVIKEKVKAEDKVNGYGAD
jgi:hypothetical protein